MQLLKGFIFGLIAQILTFFQLQGQMKKVLFILSLVVFAASCSNSTSTSGVDTLKCADSTCGDSTKVVKDTTGKDSL